MTSQQPRITGQTTPSRSRSSTAIFVSYNYADFASVKQLHDQLLSTWGADAYLDRRSMRSGIDWQAEVNQVIRQAGVCIVVLGATGWGDSQNYELDCIVARAAASSEARSIRIELLLLEAPAGLSHQRSFSGSDPPFAT